MKTDYKLRILLGAGVFLVLAMTLFCAYRLFGVGILSWHIVQKETLSLYLELSLLFVALYGILQVKDGWIRWGGFVGILLIFFWIHVVFLPMIIAALYLCFLYALGKWFRVGILHGNDKEWRYRYADGLLGAVLVILLFCLLSVFQIGGYKKQLLALGVIALPLSVWVLKRGKGQKEQIASTMRSLSFTRGECVVFALITVLVCLQIGRMNIVIDYDSLWYGLRSEYILDNGKGIYENLGTLGVVYTYSKALEILLLPFAPLPSHAFVLAFSVYVTVGAILVLYQTAKIWMPASYARLAALCLASVPAVMNMSISAKTDATTLFIQLLMWFFLLQFQKEQQEEDLVWAACMLLFSFTLKPTSIVFSSAVFGMSLLYFLVTRQWKRPKRFMAYLPLIPFLAEVFAVFWRTWKITGVPVTSVYTSLFKKLGFSIRYPFDVPTGGKSEMLRIKTMSFAEKGERFLHRLYGIFLCPEEKVDMAHVIFAWGGLFCLVFMVIGLLWLCFRVLGVISVEKIKICTFTKGRYLLWVLLPVTAGSLYVLYDLSQVDGNYYNFPYALCIFAGCYGISRSHSKEIQRVWKALLLPAIVLGIVMSSVTNWDWQIGLTPVTLKHKGYYPHEQREYESLASGEFSNVGLWNIIAENPRNRIISFGEHPKTLVFPCSMQSYSDISGSWGNPMVVETVDKFRTFASYAKTDYVYIQANYMCRWEDPYPFLCKLIYQGVLTDIIFENGNALARVNPEGIHDEKAEEQLRQFEQIYHPADWPQRLH